MGRDYPTGARPRGLPRGLSLLWQIDRNFRTVQTVFCLFELGITYVDGC